VNLIHLGELNPVPEAQVDPPDRPEPRAAVGHLWNQSTIPQGTPPPSSSPPPIMGNNESAASKRKRAKRKAESLAAAAEAEKRREVAAG